MNRPSAVSQPARTTVGSPVPGGRADLERVRLPVRRQPDRHHDGQAEVCFRPLQPADRVRGGGGESSVEIPTPNWPINSSTTTRPPTSTATAAAMCFIPRLRRSTTAGPLTGRQRPPATRSVNRPIPHPTMLPRAAGRPDETKTIRRDAPSRPPAPTNLARMADSNGGTLTSTMPRTEYRIEHDTMGEVRVPSNAKYQAQTQRAVENFPVSGRGMDPAQIRALALIKGAAARVNADTGRAEARGRRGSLGGRGRRRLRRARRRVPDRRVPDRVRHQLQHERQRGHRDGGQRDRGGQRGRTARARSGSIRTTTSTPRSRATTCSRPRSTSPPPRPWSTT